MPVLLFRVHRAAAGYRENRLCSRTECLLHSTHFNDDILQVTFIFFCVC